jgi:hypothetical protein
MGDVVGAAGEEVVEAEHLGLGGQQPLAQMAPEKTCSTGDDDPHGSS